MPETKPPRDSWTLWVNGIGLAASMGVLVAQSQGVTVGVDEQAAIATGLGTLVNIFFRFKTNTGISFKK